MIFLDIFRLGLELKISNEIHLLSDFHLQIFASPNVSTGFPPDW